MTNVWSSEHLECDACADLQLAFRRLLAQAAPLVSVDSLATHPLGGGVCER